MEQWAKLPLEAAESLVQEILSSPGRVHMQLLWAVLLQQPFTSRTFI